MTDKFGIDTLEAAAQQQSHRYINYLIRDMKHEDTLYALPPKASIG